MVPGGRIQPEFERDIVAAFAELRAPLFGPDNARPGFQRLELSLAGRIEHYADVGETANPKLGVLYAPNEELVVRASYGRSYRAPALVEVFDQSNISATFLPGPAGEVLSLYLYGGNRDLRPETAKTLTLGFEYQPSWAPGLNLSATWFDIRYKDRIEQPVLLGLTEALTNPAFSEFVTRIDPSQPADLARIQALLADPRYLLPGVYPAEAFGAIVEARVVNAAALRVSGLDVGARFSADVGPGRLDLSANASYLDRYARRLTAAAPAVSVVDTAGNPIDLRARGLAVWSQGDLNGSLAVNYVDDYRDAAGNNVDAWTTFDVQAQWRSPARSGLLEGLTLTASLQNVFDTDPPFYNAAPPSAVGYDAANAHALGRFASIQLTKRW